MSKQAFTPGPWIVVPQSDGSAMVAHEFDTGQQMQPKGLRLVCHVLARRNSLPMDEANARLIAAAPELYEALDDMYRWATHQKGFDSTEWADARAALAKAVQP